MLLYLARYDDGDVVGTCSCAQTAVGEKRYAYGILVGRSEGKRPLRRPRCRWEDNFLV
jgi:hypothetical protein